MQQREGTSEVPSVGDTSPATPAWLDSFAVGDYYTCYWNIHSQPLESLPYEALQICLICLARLALRAVLTVTASAILKNPQLSDWQRALLSITLGDTDPSQLLPQANTRECESQLLFYAGARQRTLLGRGSPPGPLFERYKQTGAQTVEARLAEIEQARIVEADSPVSRLIRTAAQIQFAELNMDRGDFQQATNILTGTLEASLRLLGPNHLVTAAVFDDLAEVMFSTNRLGNTLVFAEQAFAIHLELFGRHAPETSADCYKIGATLAGIGRHAAGIAYLEEALALRRTLFGDPHPSTAATRTMLGEALSAIRRESGNAGISEEEAARAQPIRWEQFDQKHAEGIDRLTRLAVLFRSASAMDIARFYLLQAVAAGRDLPEDHLETSMALVELAHLWDLERKLPDACLCLQEALDILHKVPSENGRQVTTVLHRLAAVHERIGDRQASLACRLEEIATLRRLSEGDSQLAEALTGLAEWYKDAGDLSAARPCLEEALSINERTLDPADPAVWGLRSMLASTLSQLQDHASARSQLEKSLTALRGAGEPFKSTIAFLRIQLAVEELALGSGDSAKQNLEQGMSTLKESEILQSSPLKHLSGLAARLIEAGQFMAARDILEPAWSRLHDSGQETEIGALLANDLGMTLSALGDYSRGRRLLERALAIRMKLFGAYHVQTAQSLNNMAYALEDAGDLDGALARYKQALTIRKALLGPNHSSTLHTINNVAVVLRSLARYSEAREYYEEAFGIQNLIASESKDARSLVVLLSTNFGRLLYVMGEFGQARYWAEESLRIGRNLWPAGNSDLAGPLHVLGDVLVATAEYDAALPYLEEALALIQDLQGSRVRDAGAVLNSMAALYIRTERPRDAWRVLQQSAQIEDFLLTQTFCAGSERQRKAVVELQTGTLYGCLTLVLKHFCSDAAVVRVLFDMVLRRKGISAEALAIQRDAILRGRHPELQQSLEKLRRLRAQLAKLLLEPSRIGATHGAHDEAVSKLTAEKEQLETQLAYALPELQLAETFRTADVDSVARAVPDGYALVEFVRFPIYDMEFTLRTYARSFARSPAFRYVAFVMPAKASAQLRMIDLGDMIEIHRHLVVLRNSIAGGYSMTRDLGPAEHATAEFDAENARWLRETLFDPVAKQVGDCRKLILAPDGELNRLSFGILPTDSERCLLESWLLSYIGVGRDLLRLSAPLIHSSHDAIVAAAPNFDLVAQTTQSAKTEPASAAAAETTESPTGMPSAGADTPGRVRDGLTEAKWKFTDLSGAKEEATKVSKILGVKPHTGDDLTLEWIRSCHSPWILHFATHGFFLEPERSDTALGSTDNPDHMIPGTMQNPLPCSGLALAGANSWLDHRPLPVEVGSGILTANDVTGLDLLNTELVVLSACNTGLGKESFADGVQGLRRSFILAGARTIVMSLWKVPDAETRDLMVWFYKLLRRGAGRAEALRRAQRHIMRRHPKVFSWGAFICQGQPGALTWPSQSRGDIDDAEI
jgi:tetratricopeptide (TPR) repeat protein